MFRTIGVFELEKKNDMLILKVMIKNLYYCFYTTKTQHSFILIIGVLGKGDEVSLSKWNQGKTIEISYYVGKIDILLNNN